jgi:copper chaperone CopZ
MQCVNINNGFARDRRRITKESMKFSSLLFLAALSVAATTTQAHGSGGDASCMTSEAKAAAAPLAAVSSPRASAHLGEKVALEVTKMHCGACAAKVRKKIRELSAAQDIVVDLQKAQASFTCEQKSCDLKQVVSDLAEMGYPSRLL